MNSFFKEMHQKGLIVEDDIPNADALKFELELAFPKTHVDVAYTVVRALEFLDEALASGEPYDFAIIDFKLPKNSISENPEPDFEISRSFERESRDTILIHTTAYKGDLQIQRFLAHRNKSIDAGRLCVAKEGADWPNQLIHELIRSLHCRRVRRRLDALFLREESSGRGRIGDGGRSDRERSLYMAELCADASQHWDDLTESLQNQLKNAFGYTSIERDGHTLHLLGVARRPSLHSTNPAVGEVQQ